MTNNQTRTRYTAKYSYPGSFFAESMGRDIPNPSYESAIAAAEGDGNWYAVEVFEITERRFTAQNGAERWIEEDKPVKVGSWVIGNRVHWQDIPDTPENEILRSNIRGNSEDGYGVKTRCGNWQIASDYMSVVAA